MFYTYHCIYCDFRTSDISEFLKHDCEVVKAGFITEPVYRSKEELKDETKPT